MKLILKIEKHNPVKVDQRDIYRSQSQMPIEVSTVFEQEVTKEQIEAVKKLLEGKK